MKFQIDFFDERKPWKWAPKDLDLFLPGTQSWLLELCVALKRRGHHITIWWDDKELEWNGIQFKDRKFYDGSSQISVAWNHPNAIPKNLKSEISFLWTNSASLEPEDLDDVDRVICISQFQEIMIRNHLSKRIGKQFHENEITHCIYPGIDPDEFSLEEKVERDPYLAFYGSSWDRGLDRLLGCWAKIKREIPEMKLIVSYSRDFMRKVTGTWYPVPKEWREHGIEFMPLGQKEMGKLYRKASFLLYPCAGQEMFCLTAWKAQYAGCLPITTDHDALIETVYAGVKTNSSNWINEAISTMKSPRRTEKLLSLRKDMNFPTWDEIALEWEDLLSWHFEAMEQVEHVRR